MRLFFLGVACVALLCVAAPAHASALGLLYKDNVTINHLEDNDWETAIQNDNNSTLDVGDYLVGMFEIQLVRDVIPGTKPNVSPTTNTFTGVFLIEIATKVVSATLVGGFDFTFTPVAAATWGAVGLGLPTPSAAGGGTLGFVFDDSSSPFVDPNPGGGLAGALATATDGIELWEVGFIGDADEIWEATGPDSFGSFLISDLDFSAALNVTEAAAGTPLLLPHNFVYNGVTAPLRFSQWQLTGEFETGGAQDLANFSIKTDTDLYIRPTPEPGSLALIGLGLAALGGVVYRRRRAA